MSDLMLYGVLRMPYNMAMATELSRRQFYSRAQEAANRLEAAESAAAPQAARDGENVVVSRELMQRIYDRLCKAQIFALSTEVRVAMELPAAASSPTPAPTLVEELPPLPEGAVPVDSEVDAAPAPLHFSAEQVVQAQRDAIAFDRATRRDYHGPAQLPEVPASQFAWSYECLQPGGQNIWCEFISRDKPSSNVGVRNVQLLMAWPACVALFTARGIAPESAVKPWQRRSAEYKTKWHRLPPPAEDFMRQEVADWHDLFAAVIYGIPGAAAPSKDAP